MDRKALLAARLFHSKPRMWMMPVISNTDAVMMMATNKMMMGRIHFFIGLPPWGQGLPPFYMDKEPLDLLRT